MREIKFRAWDKDQNKIITVCELDWYSPNMTLFVHNRIDNGGANGERFTIMQYTGLKDKNGKEIYEGDLIIAYRENDGGGNHFKSREVHWQPHRAGWNVSDKSKKRNTGTFEVVGNIYEHPELLSDK